MATVTPPASGAASPEPQGRKDPVDRIGKTITTAAAIIGLVVTANTFVVSCTKDNIDRTTSFRNAVKAEQEFWSGLYGRYLAAVTDGNSDMSHRRSKLMAIAMLATHQNPDFDEFSTWYGSDDQAREATKQLERMRRILHEALRDERSSNAEIAQEIGTFFDEKSAVRERKADDGRGSSTPPAVTAQAQSATEERAQNQSPLTIAPPDAGVPVEPFRDSRILAAGSSTGWDVDIFWCVGGPSEEQTFRRAFRIGTVLAEAAQTGRRLGDGVTLGRIRLRSIPDSQQTAGYFYTRGDSIVADGGRGEKEAAQVLGAFVGSQTRTPLQQVRSVGSLTSWYLSINICPRESTAAPSPVATSGAPTSAASR